MPETNVELVKRLFIAWQAGAMEELDDLLAPDVEWRPTALSDTGHEIYRGHAGVHEWITSVLSRHGEVRNEIHEIRDLGDRVLVLGHVHERVGDELRADADLAWLFNFHHGQIVRGEGFLSIEEALVAAGVVD
jgi:ketosteroid isomerase-like protein